jgi:hypothetical protein
VRERDRLEVGHGLREAVGHGLPPDRRRCDLQGARERPARGGSRLREAVGHGLRSPDRRWWGGLCESEIGSRWGGLCEERPAWGGWKSRKREQKERRE